MSSRRNKNGFGRGQGKKPTAPRKPLTVREKKKELISERIHSDPVKSRGMRALGIITASLMLMRAALFIYELVFYASGGQGVEIVSNLLLLPLLIILFMVHDGNRGLIGITAASAVIRLIYLFAVMYPEIEALGGATVFAAVYTLIMAVQFILSVIALSMPSTDAYAKEMQKINYELRSHIGR